MTLHLKKNPKITFIAPNIRFVDCGIIKWYVIENKECTYPRALSAYDWEEVKEK